MSNHLNLENSIEFAENPEPRCPCILLLDTSGSMQGAPIAALNDGIRVFKNSLSNDPLASLRVEVAIVTFDSRVTVVQDFVTVDQFEPPILTAQGVTHTGSGILKALDMIQARKAQYRANGVTYYRPWVFMITDGEPQGEPDEVVQKAALRIKADEGGKRVAFFAVGVENANTARLATIVQRAPVKLCGLNFQDLFLWLSKSMGAVAQSKPDDQVPLSLPDWTTI